MTWFHGWLRSVDNVCSKGESGESDVFDRNCSRKRFVTKLSDRGNYYFFSDACIGLLLVVFCMTCFGSFVHSRCVLSLRFWFEVTLEQFGFDIITSVYVLLTFIL